MATETLKQRAERYLETECISSTEYRALTRDLLSRIEQLERERADATNAVAS